MNIICLLANGKFFIKISGSHLLHYLAIASIKLSFAKEASSKLITSYPYIISISGLKSYNI